jgi:hypothetical protein
MSDSFKLASELVPGDVILSVSATWNVLSIASNVTGHRVRLEVARMGCPPGQPPLAVLVHPDERYTISLVAA